MSSLKWLLKASFLLCVLLPVREVSALKTTNRCGNFLKGISTYWTETRTNYILGKLVKAVGSSNESRIKSSVNKLRNLDNARANLFAATFENHNDPRLGL